MKKIITILMFIFLFTFSVDLLAYDINKDDKVYVSGQTIGIKLNSGVEVVGTYGIKMNNVVMKPWDDAGITEHDKIIKYNDYNIESNKDLINALKASNGEKSSITYLRNNKEYITDIVPVYINDEYSLGLYVKDSIIGVGTLTYYLKEANVFGSLGHKITNDNFYSGEILDARVDSIIKPQKNKAGEKRATIENSKIGTVVENTNSGVHGNASSKINVDEMKLLNFKTRDEINLGEAEIWTCITKDKIEKFKINITSLKKQNKNDIKGISFEVVDDDLIKRTGGIVQGMSGSPIVQDDKLIGAVTHVSVNDATKAYGIYIEWMFEDMQINIVE